MLTTMQEQLCVRLISLDTTESYRCRRAYRCSCSELCFQPHQSKSCNHFCNKRFIVRKFLSEFNKWNSLITQAYRIRSGSFVSAHLHDTLRFVPWTSPSSCNENTTALAWYWAIAHKWATPVHLPENIWSNHSWLISVLWEWQPRSS